MAIATFGAGCFWGVELTFSKLPGVTATRVGYMGGQTERPTYRDVCNGDTYHAEVVEVEYDDQRLDYADLLKTFFACHDPTQVNRQARTSAPSTAARYFFTTTRSTPRPAR